MFLKGNATSRGSFLSKMLMPLQKRAFSRAALQAFISADQATTAAETLAESAQN
jgi:hypothetical protein